MSYKTQTKRIKYIKQIVVFVLMVCLCMPTLFACAENGASGKTHQNNTSKTNTHTPAPTEKIKTPAPTKTPDPTEPPEEDEPEDILYQAFVDGFRDDLLLIYNDTLRLGYDDASKVIAAIERYVLKYKFLPELMDMAVDKVLTSAKELYPGKEIEIEKDFTLPEWQYLAAALPFMDDAEEVIEFLGLKIKIREARENVGVTLSCEPKLIMQFAEDMANSTEDESLAPNQYLNIRFTYAYLKAVYDEKGQERTDIHTYFYPFTEKYKAQLVWPLEDFPWFNDTWAQGRSQNTRAHMGTDIKMPEDSAIYSCTDGVVLYKGTADIPGNYVIVLDDDGFEYHYYHMCRVSEWVQPGDRVKKGQRIGDVGDTGNSDAPHLHISIIEPKGEFINPYQLMMELKGRYS